MKTALEIERKFLLSNLPNFKGSVKVIHIIQHYCSSPNEPDFRVRKSLKYFGDNNNVFTITIKKFLAPGTYEETEGEITQEEYELYVKNYSKSSISKRRWIKVFGELKWEIDIYDDLKLVIAEIELPSMEHSLEIPNYIQEVLIMEVTQFSQFTNKNLSLKKN